MVYENREAAYNARIEFLRKMGELEENYGMEFITSDPYYNPYIMYYKRPNGDTMILD